MSTELTTSQPTSSQILEDAWFRFAKYDKNAVIAQNRFIWQRKWILGLGVAATTLAVLYSTTEQTLAAKKVIFPTWLSQQQFLDMFHFVVVAVPIIVTVLVTFSEKFNMGISWVMLRSSAEAIKKEIYRYRMQVEEYSSTAMDSAETRDVRLARKMKVISKRLMETPVNQTDLVPYKGDLPPLYATPAGDDGFTDLRAEQYLAWRVEDQFNYYQKKAARLGRELRQFQAVIILLGGTGALLAAIKLDIWLAVSNALAVALTSYLEFKRVDTNVVACNLAASDLYDIRVWWHALSPEARGQQFNIETLVSSTEAVLQTENAGWLQEMREALAEIYKEKQEANKEKVTLALPGEVPAQELTEAYPNVQFQPKFTGDDGAIAALPEGTTASVNPDDSAIVSTTEETALADSSPDVAATTTAHSTTDTAVDGTSEPAIAPESMN